MGKKCLLGLVIVIIVISAVAWEVFRPHEPMYDGKPLSYWLEGYRSKTETSVQLSDRALRAIGTNAIPYLISMLREKDTPTKERLNALLRKQQIFKYRPLYPNERADIAASGLHALRSDARFAVPDLIDLLQTNYSDWSRWMAAAALGDIGPSASNAVPALVQFIDSTGLEHGTALYALGNIHSRAEICVPAMIGILNNSKYDDDKVAAAEALGRFGSGAKSAVSDLMELAKKSDGDLLRACLKALKSIDPQAAAKAEAEIRGANH